MQVYRTEYYEPKLGRWVGFYEAQSVEAAKECLDTPIAGNPAQRVALYERSGVRKIKYKYIRTI